jgi:exodeoxyribonuclease VII large subunit
VREEKEKIYTVMEILTHINSVLKPIDATVQGEIGKVNIRGNAVYFTVNDTKEKAVLDCIIWRSRLQSTGIELREGLEIKMIGSPKVYEPMGRLSFEARYISPVGEGVLKIALENLKKKLQEAGYFAEVRKRLLPPYIRTIGLITADQREAQKDFLTHLGNYGFTIYFHDVRVEEVAKAIFSSKIPVISAVGHENDVTIADFVADVRASTPTHAGKILGESWMQAEQLIERYDENISALFRQHCRSVYDTIDVIQNQILRSFNNHLQNQYGLIVNIDANLTSRMQLFVDKVRAIESEFKQLFQVFSQHTKAERLLIQDRESVLLQESARWYHQLQQKIEQQENQLILSDPEKKLKQGYSIVSSSDGTIVRSIEQVHVHDTISIKVYKGIIKSEVTDKN